MQVFKDELSGPILGSDNQDLTPMLRRVVNEAYTLCVSDLRRRVEPDTKEEMQELPRPERDWRLTKLSEILKGFTIVGENCPSSKCVNLFHTMYEKNALRYIEWHDCTRKDAEDMNEKIEESLKFEGNALKRYTATQVPPADCSTDHKVRCALRRRAISTDVANLISFDVLEEWHGILFYELDAEVPPGYQKVNIEQLRLADREIFKRAADSTNSIRPDASGARPLDKIFQNLAQSTTIRLRLAPLRSASASGSGGSGLPSPSASRNQEIVQESSLRKRVLELENQNKQLREDRDKRRRDQGQGYPTAKGKGDGKGKKQKLTQSRPAPLRDFSCKTPSNDKICYDFNLKDGGCPGAPPGGRCARGVHVCAQCGQAQCGHRPFRG